MSDQDFAFRLRNSGQSELNVYVEPWGEAYKLKPDQQMQVQVRGPSGTAANNLLEIQWEEKSISLWGWSRSGITVTNL